MTTSGSKGPGKPSLRAAIRTHAARAPGTQMIWMGSGSSPASQRVSRDSNCAILRVRLAKTRCHVENGTDFVTVKEQHHTTAGAMMWCGNSTTHSRHAAVLHPPPPPAVPGARARCTWCLAFRFAPLSRGPPRGGCRLRNTRSNPALLLPLPPPCRSR
eukprot:gene24912-biopygen2955